MTLTTSPSPSQTLLARAIDKQTPQVGPQTPTNEAIALMSSNRSSYVLVVEGQKLVGIFTERDLVRAIARKIPLAGIPISQVMSDQLTTLSPNDDRNIFSVLSLLYASPSRHLPVVSEGGSAIGVITPQSLRRVLNPADMLQMRRVADVMTSQVVTARATASTAEIARLMAERRKSCIVICTAEDKHGSGGQPAGIITERDIVQLQALGLEFEQAIAAETMSTPLLSVRENTSIWEAHQLMQERRIRRLVVVDEEGSLAGVITQSTLLQSLNPIDMRSTVDLLQQAIAQKTEALKAANQQLQQEVAQRIEAEAEVRRLNRRLSQFLEAMPVGVFVIDATGQPQYLNSRAQHLLGKSIVPSVAAEELSEVYQLYLAGGKRLYPQERDPLLLALQGQSVTADDLEIRRDDRGIPIETWVTPIYDSRDRVAYAIAAFQDISDRKAAEAERAQFTRELWQLNRANERFVPNQFLKLLDKQSIVEVKVGEWMRQEMSVFFANIRGFTQLSANMSPEDNFRFINGYFARMEPAILDNQGFVDKYVGDTMMALFGGEADDALKAGIAMLKRLAEYNKTRQRPERLPISMSIGINTGELLLGTVGGKSRMDGTVLGSAASLAASVENFTSVYGVSMLIAQETFSQLKHPQDYAIREIGTLKAKGQSALTKVYEVFAADPAELKMGKLAMLQAFAEGLSAFRNKRFDRGEKAFQACLQRAPDDRVARIYLERCRRQL